MKNMIDFYNFIPGYYNDESRDFQIFTRVFDSIENSLKFDIDTINTILDTDVINNNYINSIGEKVGFFNSKLYPDDILRFILSAFPYILKYKGSLEGVRRATQAVLKINGIKDSPLIEIDNDNYIIKIGIQSNLFDISLLRVILKYILPTGYFLDIYFYAGTPLDSQEFLFIDNKDWYKLSHVGLQNKPSVLQNASSVRSEEIGDEDIDKITQGRNDTFDTVGMTYTYNIMKGNNNNDSK